MTVHFHLDGIAFTVSGTRHGHGPLATFDVHSVHIQGNAQDLKPILHNHFLERLAEAAAEAAEDDIPFDSPQPLPRHDLTVELGGGAS